MNKSNKTDGIQYIIGIDESGRGPLAGPLVVGGVLLLTKDRKEEKKIFKGIKDSKKLSPAKREQWFKFITAHPDILWTKAIIPVSVIDEINIARAANLGANKVYQKLLKRFLSITHIASDRLLCGLLVEKGGSNVKVENNSRKIGLKTLLDGGLKLKGGVLCEVITKGDEKVPTIAAASIIAKVTRDHTMLKLHKKFPQYGFDKHKGYATVSHKKSINEHGFLKEVHRKSFKPRLV